jgi:hypothetical protein
MMEAKCGQELPRFPFSIYKIFTTLRAANELSHLDLFKCDSKCDAEENISYMGLQEFIS